MKIEYILHNDIDFAKWDACISHSLNEIVYAYSWYLNIVAEGWDAIVGDDYTIVFPIVFGKKYGISYLHQPQFTQQLGLFSPSIVNSLTINKFIDAIPTKYRYQLINFNTYNNLETAKGEVIERVTYQLDLVQPYFILSSKYNENTRRNISKAIAMGVTVNRMLSVADYIQFKRANMITPLNDNQFNKLNRIIVYALEMGIGEIYAAFSEHRKLCAAAFIIRSNGKIIYLSAASNKLGKSNRAMFALVDQCINDYSESYQILDFEGSIIDSIARFYAGFGAKRCTFQQLIVNHLPWFFKLFKR